MDHSTATGSLLGMQDVNLMEQPASASTAVGTDPADRDLPLVYRQITFLMADVRANSAPPMELPPIELKLAKLLCSRHQPTNETRG